MAKDVRIIPADGDLQFYNTAASASGKIQQVDDDLVISNAVGDILFGDTNSDVYIGDGVSSVDLIFEQDGEIRGEVGSNVTLTLGSNDTLIHITGSTLALQKDGGNVGIGTTSPSQPLHVAGTIQTDGDLYLNGTGAINFSGSNNTNLLEINGATLIKQISNRGGIQIGRDDAIVIGGGESSGIIAGQISAESETVHIGAEEGVSLYGLPSNGVWAARTTLNVNKNGYVSFLTGSATRVLIHTDGDSYFNGGNVGIRTTNPSNTLQVTHFGQDSNNGILIVRGDTDTLQNDLLGSIGFDSTDGNVPSSNLEASAYIAAYASEPHGTSDKGGHLAFGTAPTNQNDDTVSSERMRIQQDGSIIFNAYGSGTHTGTAAYNLQIDSSGNIIESAIGGTVANATSASHAEYADEAGSATTATSATSASHAEYADEAGTATSATSATTATSATSASHALYADNADKVDGIQASSFLRSDATDVLSSTMKVTGNIIYESHNNQSGYIPHPKGAMYQTTTSSVTGAIKIKLPTHGAADMMTFVVDIYDYASNESLTVFIAGYAYQATGNNEWNNCTVRILANQVGKDYKVRFGADGSNSCVWIGETTDSWSYPQVIVRDFFSGFTTDIDAYDDNWGISFVTSFDTVDETLTDNLPAADWDRLEGRPSFGNAATQDTGSMTVLAADTAGSATTATTATTATNANNINVDEKNDNVNYQVLFSTANGSGNQRPYIDTDNGHFLYNPSTHTLTAGTFSGALSGNASTATSATSASHATTMNVVANDTFSGTYPVLWHAGSTVYGSSWMTVRGSDDTLLVPNILASGDITATTITGSLKGNVDGVATNAHNINIDNNTTITNGRIMFADGSGTGYERPRVHDGGIEYNAATQTLVVSNLTGNASSATSASHSSTIDVNTASVNSNYDIVFTDGNGNLLQDTGGNFAYDNQNQVLNVSFVSGQASSAVSASYAASVNYSDIIGIPSSTDTNIANTNLTASADRSLDMDSQNLTLDNVATFTVDASAGGITLASTGETFLTGISDEANPVQVLTWNPSQSGKITYTPIATVSGVTSITAGTGISVNQTTGGVTVSSTVSAPTIYTPDIYEINDISLTGYPYFLEFNSTKIANGSTDTSVNTAGDGIEVNQAGWYEAKYSVAMQNPGSIRLNVAIRAEFSDTVVEGSRGIAYMRLTGTNQAPFGSVEVSFYFQVSGGTAGDALKLKLNLLNGSGTTVVDGYHATKNTLSIRRLT